MLVHMLSLILELEVFNLKKTERKYKDFYSLWSTQVLDHSQPQSDFLNIRHCKIYMVEFLILLLSKSFFNVYFFNFLTLSSDRCSESNYTYAIYKLMQQVYVK